MRQRVTLWMPAVIVAAALQAGAMRAAAQEGTTGAATQEQASPQAAAFTIDGDAALWTVAIRPDRTADFERIMARLQQGLQQSDTPERQRQAAGWKLLRIDTPMPDGNIAYVHVINPVVRGADYGVLQILYDEFPDEQRELYELYRGAFAQNLSLATGAVVRDLSKTE